MSHNTHSQGQGQNSRFRGRNEYNAPAHVSVWREGQCPSRRNHKMASGHHGTRLKGCMYACLDVFSVIMYE